jgi:DNA-binding beta-propeller fold protein YncE
MEGFSMARVDRFRVILGAAVTAVVALAVAALYAQATATPTNDLPNPYQTIEGYFKLPEGRTWGSTSAVDVSPDGKFIWVAERCGANSCWDAAGGKMSPLDVVLKFDQSGKLVGSFGAGMMVFPHGIHVDRQGNVWVTDGNDNLPRRRPGAAADAPLPPAPEKVIGHQVFKFSPDGKLLLTLGKAGGNPADSVADPGSFYQPNDVITLANGDILVAEGHNDGTMSHRIVHFTKDGKYLSQFGKRGNGPGEFMQPHALALDSQGRLFVGDRGNNRVQIMTTDGKFIADWAQFSRPSGLFIDTKTDTLYSADSESGSVNPPHKAWTRGIRVGSAKDGKVMYFIPDPQKDLTTGTLAAEGVAVDSSGNVYGAEVGPKKVQKYVLKK